MYQASFDDGPTGGLRASNPAPSFRLKPVMKGTGLVLPAAIIVRG